MGASSAARVARPDGHAAHRSAPASRPFGPDLVPERVERSCHVANHADCLAASGPTTDPRPSADRPRPVRVRRWLAAAAALALTVAVGACSSGSSGSSDGGAQPASLRLGYFPNLTHATALVGIQEGIFQRNLGDTKLETRSFNAGINAYAQSGGKAVRITSGATSGGALLIVRTAITDAQGLRGKKIATPQLGNTQDVALRSWLAGQGFKTDTQGGGDVQVVNHENAQT